MKVLIFVALVCCCCFAANFRGDALSDGVTLNGTPTTWTLCGNSTDDVAPKSLHITTVPNPVIKGQPVNITILGHTTKNIEKIKAHVELYMFHIEVLSRDVDDCCGNSYTHCPYPPGPFLIQTVQTIPKDSPSGHYNAHMQLLDQDDHEIVCLIIDCFI
jgi:hypothetical protein